MGTAGSGSGVPNSFYGRTLRSRTEPHFRLAERVYQPSYSTPMHIHAKPLLCMVLDGAYYETHCGRTYYCTPGTILYHAPNQDHRERFEPVGGRSLIVEIDHSWMNPMQESVRASMDVTTVFDDGPLSLVGSRLYKEFLSTDQASHLVIEGLMLEAAGEIVRVSYPRDRRPPRWLERARDLIREEYLSRWSLDQVAKTVDVHPVHLAQAFRKFYRTTVGDYVRTLRIGFACQQLRRPDVPLNEIARMAGFADQSHFTRTFKKTVGMAPSHFREAVGNSDVSHRTLKNVQTP